MLRPGCPRCLVPSSVPAVGSGDAASDGEWTCVEHGRVPVLWRPETSGYDAFVQHLRGARSFPTLLPWPMGPDWRVSDFAWVGATSGPVATLTTSSGTTDLDGPVDVLVVLEEPGTGLGPRVAGLGSEVSAAVGQAPPLTRVRVERTAVPLWTLSTSGSDGEWDRSVLVGEALGRWLWVVLRPASAVLLMRDEWILRDLAEVGPTLVEMPFRGPGPVW